MRTSQDKLNETRHFYHEVIRIIDLISEEKEFENLLKLISQFRFQLNAFVNAYRATTFTLQAELKSKYGDKFTTWYEVQLKKISSFDFTKVLKELRNINQKRGNKYPTFIFEGESEKSIIHFE